MARYRVDPILCQGYGMCAEHAPTVFILDEWGYAQAVRTDLDGQLDDEASFGVKVCPVKAIRQIDD